MIFTCEHCGGLYSTDEAYGGRPCVCDAGVRRDRRVVRLKTHLLEIEQHCPCGARPESPATHPHVLTCPVELALIAVNDLLRNP